MLDSSTTSHQTHTKKVFVCNKYYKKATAATKRDMFDLNRCNCCCCVVVVSYMHVQE
eukprot:m.23938 g.23938  ORF g.23938 m.23938 type:complete len:57 (-) comp7556_c0_seq2:180-350(-)